jgi:hypothetical protein
MSDEFRDPSGNTEAFRAFVRREDAEPPAAKSNLPLLIGAAVAVLIVVIVVVAVAMS